METFVICLTLFIVSTGIAGAVILITGVVLMFMS